MAQKNTLQYIILGMLQEGQKTGYDIKTAFTTEIGEFWQAKHSQIYPELSKLTKKGWINFQTEIVGTKLEKKVYSLTDAGRIALLEWLKEPLTELPTNKDEFVLKLYFIKSIEDERLPEMIQQQIELHQKKLEHLESRRHIVFPDEKIQENYGHYLILMHAIHREEEYLSWLGSLGATRKA
ncbi:helix-turn-helix transcriptional regulator [Candidatus Enterococcus murrayae]|uniref:PadR family transcriptional regulator n=1 Tax=Candidatus Enterococcus murrayae TaxID=2815321 RepID=A0ABS3HHR0_9ENTE|nr:PadR family transcriptional regulator [Enterococcus sp. MJM16]